MSMKEPEQPTEEEDKYTPEWAKRAEHIPHKPKWVDFIPHRLWELGEVFFPIPRREKGWNYPHHMDEKRFSADDEILNAYLESGAGYGISCAGDLAVIDIDEKEYADFVTHELPETIWQITGSREGYHLFYFVPDLDTRIILRVEIPITHTIAEGIEYNNTSRHFGEVKCDPHGYVVGPGSIHPSGNRYGPLKGDSITEITKEELEDALSPITPDNEGPDYSVDMLTYEPAGDAGVYDDTEAHEFFTLSADDVTPWLEYEKRIAHPVHGSETGMNFMKNKDGETFTCWRCQFGTGDGCGLNGTQFLAAKGSGKDCDVVRRKWRRDYSMYWHAWTEAVKMDLVSTGYIPYGVIKGYAVYEGIIDNDEEVKGEQFWDMRNAVKYISEYEEWEL